MAAARDVLIDGEPATADDLLHPALVNYGAHTSFRVDHGAARGLDRHLARLNASALELFGVAVDEASLRDRMRRAVAGHEACWLRIGLFSPGITPRTPAVVAAPRIMSRVTPAPAPLAGPMRVQPQTHARVAAHLKHAATFDLIRARRLAMQAGFDDALFTDDDGAISEGTLWNIGFMAGETVVWPQAPMLAGVTQALLAEGLAAQGARQETRPVTLGDLAAFDAAFLCNSATPACAIAAIGDVVFDVRCAPLDRLRAAWTAAPAQPI